MLATLVAVAAATAAVALPPPPAQAAAPNGEAVVARLHASFTPDRLGAPTTIGFGFTVRTAAGLAPPPLTAMDLQMPAGMDYIDNTLGLAICHPKRIIAYGRTGCPVNSKLGYGSAYVEVPFGNGAGHELPQIEAFMGPTRNENMVVLFYVNGEIPVFAQLVFSGEVRPDSGLFGSQLAATIPLVESITEGPDVSIVRTSATIGPKHVLYRRMVHGRVQRFHPRGIAVPSVCPKGGFPFAASFTFQGGAQASASTTVPCPPAKRRRRGGRRHRRGRGHAHAHGRGHGRGHRLHVRAHAHAPGRRAAHRSARGGRRG